MATHLHAGWNRTTAGGAAGWAWVGGRRAWFERDDDADAIVRFHAVGPVQAVVPAVAVVWAHAQACPGRHGEHEAQGRVVRVGVFGDVRVVGLS